MIAAFIPVGLWHLNLAGPGGLDIIGWLVLAMTAVTAWAVAWEYIRPRLAALGSWWWRHCQAYCRDLRGKDGKLPPLPQRKRKPPPPCWPDGDPLTEWEANRWRRLVRNYGNDEKTEPRRPR
jgi:hypothetical protein